MTPMPYMYPTSMGWLHCNHIYDHEILTIMALLPLAVSMPSPNPVMPKPQKPLYSFPNSKFPCQPKSSSKTMGKPGCRGNCGVIPINMALITTEDGVTRRIGNHHPNLWEDSFIQSLPANYEVWEVKIIFCFDTTYEDFILIVLAKILFWQAPYYVERAEKLIADIKNTFNVMHNSANTSPLNDLSERLSLVDVVQRLGIGRHFPKEIKQALDYVYRFA